MNTDLEPPRVPPLSAAERSRLRNQVMDRARPVENRPSRRMIAPVIAVAAVAAAVAGTLVITNRPPADPGVAAPATVATSSGLGVVSDADAIAAFTKSCERRQHSLLKRPFRIVWARRVPAANPGTTDILMIVEGSGTSGISSCLSPGGSGGWQRDKSGWIEPPAQKKGLTGLSGGTSSVSTPKPMSRIWMLYRVRPEIARIESRLVWKGVTSPWQPGYVDHGYAYADNRLAVVVPASTVRQEVRAYDAQGRLLPYQPK
ncbi:hypothetical protein ACQPYH_22505 [Kribbella sp. CA-245084]|uniref:hypothetical protein n=1 Tax=Kribbella sp. CA-245084 TaxID=3239940 RepID=UPI003D909EE9